MFNPAVNMGAVDSCYGCEKPIRHIGCHATCEKYKTACEKNEQIKELKSKANDTCRADSAYLTKHSYTRQMKQLRKMSLMNNY